MIDKNKALLPFVIITLGFCFLALRLFFIQVWEHDRLSKKVDRITVREKSKIPLRGMILDKDGRVLAMSVKTYTFFADPTMCEGLNKIASELKKTNISIDIKSLNWNKNSSFIPLLENLDEAKMLRIKALEIKGTNFVPKYVRQYPEIRMACHLVGVVGIDGKGLSGIEFSRDKELRGDKQKYSYFRDGMGREISEKLNDFGDLQGSDIYLTIDRNLQYIAEKEIDIAYKKLNPKKATIIIQDPNSGEILAMASRPDYDPKQFPKTDGSLKNYALSDIFEPGSTFKIVAMVGALEEKIAKLSDTVFCENGKFVIYEHTIKDHEKQGNLTLNEIMEYSSNIGMAKLGAKLGKEKMFQYIRQFGFGTKTGIDLPGEAKGLLSPPEKWSGLSVSILSFGQEVGATAMQIVNAYSAIANGGFLIEPRIIKYSDAASAKNKNGEKRIIRRVASPETIKQLKIMLTNVVDKGTGINAKIPGYSVAGKTGTAQKRDLATGQYSTSAYVSSFCGFIPVHAPKLTILVVLDEPKGDYWGSSTAAPIFKSVAIQAARYMKISPDRKLAELNS